MSMDSDKKLADMDDKALKRTAEMSVKIREAIRAALPTPPEQFLTVMVPGKVVNFDVSNALLQKPINSNFADTCLFFKEFVIDKDPEALLSTRVELAQARLCDDMPALGAVQLGPTGRSVSRSYANAISKLVPAGERSLYRAS